MAFEAILVHVLYWDADIQRQVTLQTPCYVKHMDITSDMAANAMHEACVAEIIQRLEQEV